MLKNLLSALVLLFSVFVHAQIKTEDTNTIDKKIKECRSLAMKNPKQATLILKQIKKESEQKGYKTGILESSTVLTLLYYNMGDYKKVIEETRTTQKLAKELEHTEYISDSYRMRGIAYGEMNFVKECFNELDKSLEFALKIKKPNKRLYKTALIYESIANSYDKEGDTKNQLYYRKKCIQETKKISEKKQDLINAKYQNLAYQYASIGFVYSNLKVNDSALYYFEKALEIHENKRYDIYINGRATLLSDMAKFYYNNKNYNKAIKFAKKAESFEKQSTIPYIRRDIFETLFNSYVETDKDSSKYYLKLYTSLNDSIIKVEKKSIYAPVKQIILDNETEKNIIIKSILIIAGFMSIIVLLGGWVFWQRKNEKLQKGYENLIDKLKSENTAAQENIVTPVIDIIDSNNAIEKSLNIADSTLNSVILKLKKFENSEKYIKNEVNLTYLANYVGTNTKSLSEVIKQYKGKPFNSYINGLRIDYIVKLLYKDPKLREYKISYLGELCGFSSREVFTVIFKKETGISPSFFIENLKKEKSYRSEYKLNNPLL